MHNKHDTCIRDVLTNIKEVTLFINRTLNLKDNNKILEDMLERVDNRFVTQSYYNKETDLIYKLKNKNVYILIEHQSTSDKYMAKRIAEYQIEIMRRDGDKKKKLPLIIPIVIYTGNNKCTMKNDILKLQEKIECFENKNLGEFVLVDTNKISEDELIGAEGAFSKIVLLDKAKNREELQRIYEKINKCNLKDEEKEAIERYTCNIAVNTFEKEYIIKLREKYKTNNGGKGMLVETLKREIRREKRIARKIGIAEGQKIGIEEGKKKGIQEGMKEGRQEGIKEGMKKGEILGLKTVAKEMIRANIDIEIIKRCTKLTEKELMELK